MLVNVSVATPAAISAALGVYVAFNALDDGLKMPPPVQIPPAAFKTEPFNCSVALFAQTDWADFMAHVEMYWQDETAAAAMWPTTYDIPGGSYPYIYDHIMLFYNFLAKLI